MASDEVPEGRMPGKKASFSGFRWVSSSPTPAEIELLESRFPDIVQLPTADLEEETAEWKSRAILMRTFHRWVPSEAFLREFRRGGISGEIFPLALSHRCHIFKFADQKARDEVLLRPWVINGQPVAAEAWRPDFFPATDAITSALLWIRLPNLPIEYWREDFLRQIVEPAGQYMFADAATVAKNRAGYARVCAQVQLLSPLRPGTRVSGLQGLFWQSFVFEQLEGICPRCASLHLTGECSSEKEAAAETMPEELCFGPWLSAVRRRKAMPAGRAGGPEQKHPPTGPSSSASDAIHGRDQDMDGWSTPANLIRRRRIRRSAVDFSQEEVKGQSDGGVPSAESLEKGAMGTVACAALKQKGKMVLSGFLGDQTSKSELSGSFESRNPFASLVMDLDGDSSKGSADAAMGPLTQFPKE